MASGDALAVAIGHPAARRVPQSGTMTQHDDPTAANTATETHHETPAATGDAGHGTHDEHGHAEEPLGPIDAVAWIYSGLGVVLGLLVAGAFAVSAGWVKLA